MPVIDSGLVVSAVLMLSLKVLCGPTVLRTAVHIARASTENITTCCTATWYAGEYASCQAFWWRRDNPRLGMRLLVDDRGAQTVTGQMICGVSRDKKHRIEQSHIPLLGHPVAGLVGTSQADLLSFESSGFVFATWKSSHGK